MVIVRCRYIGQRVVETGIQYSFLFDYFEGTSKPQKAMLVPLKFIVNA